MVIGHRQLVDSLVYWSLVVDDKFPPQPDSAMFKPAHDITQFAHFHSIWHTQFLQRKLH